MNGFLKGPRRPIMRYHGGKWLLGNWVISQFPEHQVYVEPFCGAASVLAQKPRIKHEVINDLYGRVVNLFRVLRDPEKAGRLAELVYLTPYAIEDFRIALDVSPDPVEDARRLITIAGQAFSPTTTAGGKAGEKTSWRRRTTDRSTSVAVSWAAMPDVVKAWAERLKGVTIERSPAIEVIQRWDNKDVLFFVDPPYLFDTRNRGGKGYAHEMSDDQHIELAEVLLQVKGKVVLAGYPSELYQKLFKGWKQVERQGFTGGKKKVTEVLWINPAGQL